MDRTMIPHASKLISVHNVLEGLRHGLSRFSGTSRVALVMAEAPGDPLCVHDPRNLLRGHEPKLAKHFLESDQWREAAPDVQAMKPFGQTVMADRAHLAGLICSGGFAPSLFFQMWFTEFHPNMCATGPTERWLEHAVWLLAHDFASEGAFFTSASKHALEAFETHAIRNQLHRELTVILGRAPDLPLYPILEAIQKVSTTREEGERPSGQLIFIEPGDMAEVPWMLRFPELERPHLENAKHVRKLLLAVEGSHRRVVSDGARVLGISGPFAGAARLTAHFQERHGMVRLGGKPVCSFTDGAFQSSTRKPNLVLLEEALLGYDHGDRLFQMVTAIAEEALRQGFGCTLVVDPVDKRPTLAGQNLKPPLNLAKHDHLELAKSLARVDGALHITGSGRLSAFACLLDGLAVPSEDRSRGARFNSALRFTAMHPELLVVVVSEDAPVAIVQGGILLNAICELRHDDEVELDPPTLRQWLEAP